MLDACLLLQTLLEFRSGPEPSRFAVPLPAAAVARGLELRGAGRLGWRCLPLPERGGQVWVELAVVGASGHAVVAAPARGGTANAAAGGVRCERAVDGLLTTTTWSYVDGSVDRRVRTLFAAPEVIDDERYDGSEARTVETPALPLRCRAAARLPRRVWEAAGLLPPDQGLARAVRPWLQSIAHALVDLPGERGAGDFARSGGLVTNLEFDTTLALLRLALATGDEELLLRARRGARHLVDHDLEPNTGLPFVHGADHRSSPPEPGHAWLRGLLWTGAVTADDDLLAAAAQLAHAIAAAPPEEDGRQQRARDYAWPLAELEAYLEFVDDPVLATAADRLATAIGRRFDAHAHTFRFGEGEVGRGVYFERAWLTGGMVLPALTAHLRRRPDRDLQRHVTDVADALVQQIGNGRPGLPTHWRIAAGAVFAEHRGVHDPAAYLLLDGLPLPDLRRLLHREMLLAALLETPARDDPDLATSFTIAARCDWVYR